MSARVAARVAWTTCGATFVLAVMHLALTAATRGGIGDEVTAGWVLAWLTALIAFQSFATVGAVLASRLPGNLIGWLFCLSGFVCQLANAGGAWVNYAYDRALPGDVVTSIALGGGWLIGVYLGIVLPLYLYPDGRPLTRRWRPVVAVALAWPLVFWVVTMFSPGKLDLHPTRTNPIGVELRVVGAAVIALALPLVVLAVVAAVLRFRRSRGVERQRMRVLALTSLFVIGSFAFLALAPLPRLAEAVGQASILLLIALVPIAMGVAILRYRLYEFDRIFSRTVAYALLTVVLGASYVGLVLLGQWVFSSFAGGGDLAIAVSTLVVAALFLPVRSRVQAFVDRRFYRRRYDAQHTLEAFGARLRDEVDLVALVRDLQAVVEETMRPAGTQVWWREGRR